MSEQNMGNEQNNQTGQFSNYQDNTGNVSYQGAIVEPSEPAKANGLQIAGLVCGIVGIILSCCVGGLGTIFGIAGLICAIIGNKEEKTGVGTAGLVCSIIATVIGVIMLIVGLIYGAALLSYLGTYAY